MRLVYYQWNCYGTLKGANYQQRIFHPFYWFTPRPATVGQPQLIIDRNCARDLAVIDLFQLLRACFNILTEKGRLCCEHKFHLVTTWQRVYDCTENCILTSDSLHTNKCWGGFPRPVTAFCMICADLCVRTIDKSRQPRAYERGVLLGRKVRAAFQKCHLFIYLFTI